jgi:aspartokinase-like uncharacterized kinase
MRNKKNQSDKVKIIEAILTGNKLQALKVVSNIPKAKKHHRIILITDANGFYQDSGIGKLFTDFEANELIKDYTHAFIVK